MVDGSKNKERPTPPSTKHSVYSSTLTYNGRFCAEYLNLHVGLGCVCAERAVESDGWEGGGWRCVVTGRERHDSFISFSLPQPPQRKKTEGGVG